MSLAYHQALKIKNSRPAATIRPPAAAPGEAECAPLAAIRTAIESLSDTQVRSLIKALVSGLVLGMITDVAERADDIVDDVVENIVGQLAAAAQSVQANASRTHRTPATPPSRRPSASRTCELCGRLGSRRFVQSPTGWRCAPTATKCVGHRRPASNLDAPSPPRSAPPRAKTPAAPADRALKVVRTPGVTAQCQDCTRTWTLTGIVLERTVETHELKRGHLVTVYDEPDEQLAEA